MCEILCTHELNLLHYLLGARFIYYLVCITSYYLFIFVRKNPRVYLKKNQSTRRPSEHPPVTGEKMSKRLGGIKGCKYKISSWHLNRFPDADDIGSTV